jgi:hypothetical protein
MEEKRITPAGWGWPGLARKAHFFEEGMWISLCGKWMYAGPRDPDTSTSKDDCVSCRRKLEFLQAK